MTPRKPKGFTLFELLASLVLLSLVLACLFAVFQSPYQKAMHRQTVVRLAQIDRIARFQARRHSGVNLRIDTRRGELEIRPVSQPNARLHRFFVGQPLRLQTDSTHRVAVAPNAAVIAFDGRGRSPSYAVQIDTPRLPPTWVFIVGRSGQVLVTSDKREIDALLAPES